VSILENWGDSPECDRIRAQVAGMAPDRRARRMFMVLQVYADESISAAGNFVIAGYIGTAEEWAIFSSEWAPMAKRYGVFASKTNNHKVFKMSAMMASEDRRQYIPWFYRIIEGRQIKPFSFGINKSVFRNAVKRIIVTQNGHRFNFEKPNEYYFLFNCVVSNIARLIDKRDDLFSSDDKVDFYFDDQLGVKTHILNAWSDFVDGSNESFRSRIGQTPRFESEEDFLPIQAADFWAWMHGRWADTGNYSFDGIIDIKKAFLAAHKFLDEDGAVKIFKRLARSQYPNGVILDARIDLKRGG
jgi:hypothetical protein